MKSKKIRGKAKSELLGSYYPYLHHKIRFASGLPPIDYLWNQKHRADKLRPDTKIKGGKHND